MFMVGVALMLAGNSMAAADRIRLRLRIGGASIEHSTPITARGCIGVGPRPTAVS